MSVIKSIKVNTETGLVREHFKGSFSGKKEVTLIQEEGLNAISCILERKTVYPILINRNIIKKASN